MEDNSLAVSVVIPCYKCASTVKRAVGSALAQTLPPCEVILVDDASNDGTREVLEALRHEHPDTVRIIVLAQNSGPASARNAGWDAAKGTYVAFLDADDAWYPEKLQVQTRVMRAQPDLALTGHRHVMYADHQKSTRSATAPAACTNIGFSSLLLRNPFSTSSAMLLRSLRERFKHGERYGEDYYLWLQLAAAGHRVARIERALVTRHGALFGGVGLSGALWKMERSELRSFDALRRQGAIGAVTFLTVSLWSLVRFARRIAIITLSGRPA